MKSLPLYLGLAFIAAAIAGAAVTFLLPSQPVANAQKATATVVQVEESETEPPPGPSPEEVRAQDEQDLIEILLAQINDTPAEISDDWIQEEFRHIRSEADLNKFFEDLIAEGQRYDGMYTAANESEGVVLSRNPQFYIFEARKFIYKIPADEHDLEKEAPGLLAMAVFRAWNLAVEAAAEDEEEGSSPMLPDDVRATYFSESLKALDVLTQLAMPEVIDEEEYQRRTPDSYREQKTRVREAAALDRRVQIEAGEAAVRDRYTGTVGFAGGQSAAPATTRLRQWRKTFNQHLLELGRLYVDAALAERISRRKQREYADHGFRVLAMVYRLSGSSGDALKIMRDSNRILRYNIWQMARVAHQNAKAAVKAGNAELADDEFFLAKQRYLEALSRLERSRKPTVLDEYTRLQADIQAWLTAKSSEPAGQG
ncbi:MAG: hypothetical protein VX733_05690 [Candidatus Latescibacterota bacterium]|nr:hypothetical protein [Candidatus Latescibacterota bacterium]